MIRVVFLLAALAACHPQPIPPSPPPPDGMMACDAGVAPTQDGLCDGQFVLTGDQAYQCYACAVQQGCLDVPEQVFCVPSCIAFGGPCKLLPPDAPAGAKRATKAPRRVPARLGGR